MQILVSFSKKLQIFKKKCPSKYNEFTPYFKFTLLIPKRENDEKRSIG